MTKPASRAAEHRAKASQQRHIPRIRSRSGWESLTATEREVVRLAARGLRNGEIAEQLSVSRRTVESHLYRVFTKLGVSSRLELVVQAVSEAQGSH